MFGRVLGTHQIGWHKTCVIWKLERVETGKDSVKSPGWTATLDVQPWLGLRVGYSTGRLGSGELPEWTSQNPYRRY